MENLYNARLSFKGEGNFTFVLPNYGELTIYAGKDIYVKGLTVNGVEALRQLRPLLLDHKLNAKPDGCYKVLDLVTLRQPVQHIQRVQEPVKSVADLKAELVKTTGPIVVEEPVIVKQEDIINEEESKDFTETDIIDVEAPEVIIEEPQEVEVTEPIVAEPVEVKDESKKETKSKKTTKTGTKKRTTKKK